MATEILTSADELRDTLIEIARWGAARNLPPAQLLLECVTDDGIREGLRADPLRGHISTEFHRQSDAVQIEREEALDAECEFESFGDEDDNIDEHRKIDREHPDGWLDCDELDDEEAEAILDHGEEP